MTQHTDHTPPTDQQLDDIEAIAARWNSRYPIGTPVAAYPGARPEDAPDCERLNTRTRSEAQVLGGHTAVVWVDGHSACIALTHVDPVQSADTYTPPAKYLRSDGADCCPHGTPVGPGSCEACWDLVKWDALDGDVSAPTTGLPLTDQQLDDYETAARNAARIGSGIDPAAVLELLAEVHRLRDAMEQIRHLHKDSPMGPCPVCIDADAAAAGGDGFVPYPCPTGRLAGAQDCDPPHMRAAIESGTGPCGHDDYHDPHEWADRPGVWCPGISHADDEPAPVAVVSSAAEDGGQ